VLGDVHRPAKPREAAGGPGVLAQVRPLLVPPIMMAFGYFALVAASMSAVQIFAVSAMVTIYEVPLTLAAGALTVYMLGSAAGIVCGGFLADRMRRHDAFAAGRHGGRRGADLAVREWRTARGHGRRPPRPDRLRQGSHEPLARPARARGHASRRLGGRCSASFTPASTSARWSCRPIYGWLIDRGEPRAVFVVAAVLMALTMLTVLEVGRRGAAARAAA